MNKKRLLAIGLILLLGILFRGWDFGNNPAGITDDEASLGYNAYSLLRTGKDEYGKSMPTLIRSFGTYASSLYTYMTVVPVKLLGLNAVSVRAVSLISGIILIFLGIYLWGVIGGLVIAISPVFVFYSRSTFETNLALMILFLGLALVKKKSVVMAFVLISLSAYAYHVERVLSLILMFVLFWYFYKIPKFKKIAIVSLVLGLVIQIPLFWLSFSRGANSRISALGHSGGYLYLYSTYFSPNNIFSRPDPAPNKSFPELGIFYWWMIVPFVLGIAKIIKNKEYKSLTGILFFTLMLTAPAVAAITRDYFSTWRALPMFMIFAWFISRGLESQLNKKNIIYIFLILVAFLEMYSNLVLIKHEQSASWGYQYQALAEFVKNAPGESIVVDNTRSGSMYVRLAFYNQYDPQKFQSRFNNLWLSNYYDHVDFNPNIKMDNIDIRPIDWKKDAYQQEILVSDPLGISDSQAKEHFLDKIGEIGDINGQPVLKIYRTNPTAKISGKISQ